jgi:hypothetical protein
VKYFKHPLHLREEPRTWRLIKKHGMTGYGVLWALIEELYKAEDDGFQIQVDDLWLEQKADEYRLTDELALARFIDAFVELGFLDKQAWQERLLFSSEVLETADRYMRRKAQEAERKRRQREREKEAGKMSRGTDAMSRVTLPGHPTCPGNPDPDPDPDPQTQTQNRAGVCVDESVCGSPDQLPESPTQLEGSRLEAASHAGGDKFSAAMARAEALGVNVADKGLLNLAEMYPSHLGPAVEALAVASNVGTPTAWLKDAIREGWKPKAQVAGKASTSPEIDRFKAWRTHIQKETGHWIASQQDGDRMIVFIEAVPFPFSEVEHFTPDDYLAQVEALKSKAIA